jgi:hypothetical protein
MEGTYGRAELGMRYRYVINFAEGQFLYFAYVFEVIRKQIPRAGGKTWCGWYKLRLVRITRQPRGDYCDCTEYDCQHQIVQDYMPAVHNGVLGTVVSARNPDTTNRFDNMIFKFMGQKCTAVRRKTDVEWRDWMTDKADASWYEPPAP